MKRIIFSLLLVILLFNNGFSKPLITTRGVVVSKVNDDIVVGALIKVKGQEVMATTDVDGQFIITAEEGSTIEISCPGYKKTSQKIKPNMVIDLIPKDYQAMHWFVAATAGPLIVHNDDYYNEEHYIWEHQAAFGIMFGMMGKSWGWYVKPTMPVVFKNEPFKSQITWDLSFGAMRKIVENFNIYAGSGIGCGFWPSYYIYYDNSAFINKYENVFGDMFAIMFELGFQYNFKHINLELGLEYAMGTNDPQYQRNFKPYIGVGYNF